MKLIQKLLIAISLVLILPVSVISQNNSGSYSCNFSSGDYHSDGDYWTKEFVINVAPNTPISINFQSLASDMLIYTTENGVMVHSYESSQFSGTTTMISSSDGKIYFSCYYAPFYGDYWLVNISYSLDLAYNVSPYPTIIGNDEYISGKLGVGTSYPKEKLDVNGSAVVHDKMSVGGTNSISNVKLNISNNSENYSLYSNNYKSTSGSIYGLYSSASNSSGNSYGIYSTVSGGAQKWSGYFDGGNFAVMNGNVGIGVSNPDCLLTVNGIIHAKEVRVDMTGSLADYVFDPAYRLMPLTDVERYVTSNKHLPEVPSAADVKNNGLSLGDMQNKLLQKIEELTLYLIEQQKQISELKKQIENK